jgi:hypothetical protein
LVLQVRPYLADQKVDPEPMLAGMQPFHSVVYVHVAALHSCESVPYIGSFVADNGFHTTEYAIAALRGGDRLRNSVAEARALAVISTITSNQQKVREIAWRRKIDLEPR